MVSKLWVATQKRSKVGHGVHNQRFVNFLLFFYKCPCKSSAYSNAQNIKWVPGPKLTAQLVHTRQASTTWCIYSTSHLAQPTNPAPPPLSPTRLEYKYSRLVMSANRECELPAADSCALTEGEEPEDDVVYAQKPTLLGKLRAIANKVEARCDVAWGGGSGSLVVLALVV